MARRPRHHLRHLLIGLALACPFVAAAIWPGV